MRKNRGGRERESCGDSRFSVCSSMVTLCCLRRHIPTNTMASIMMIMKNTAATATTTYSQMEVGSSVAEESGGSVMIGEDGGAVVRGVEGEGV